MVSKHIKSSESVNPYIIELYEFAKREHYKFCLGKPFGIPRLLKHLNLPDEIVNQGFLTPEINEEFNLNFAFVEPSLGHSVGVAEGLALSDANSKVLVFISDSQLTMGQTLEAIQDISLKQLNNVLICVDYNKTQSNSKLPKIHLKSIFHGFEISKISRVNEGKLNPYKPNAWIFESFKWAFH